MEGPDFEPLENDGTGLLESISCDIERNELGYIPTYVYCLDDASADPLFVGDVENCHNGLMTERRTEKKKCCVMIACCLLVSTAAHHTHEPMSF